MNTKPRICRATGISLAFVGGTTGECYSLSLEERLALARRWSEVAQSTALKLSIHVRFVLKSDDAGQRAELLVVCES